ncbi:MAG: N-acetyl-gamma-glutamyl-phosphate reductase [Myxococcota bacterium]|jgi:N-acetyl-gamma-glutamyl-phosphate reductase|nr:N-acetyl-gamma-glutamyl-phosphate reductase [Myxococcota bacterium]
MFKAAIIGGTGYGGAEMCRQLLQHPEVELCRVVAVDEVGKKLGDVHLNLEGQTELCFEQMEPEEAAAGMDVVLLGLPHTVSAQVVPKLIPSGARIIDMSGDFRLRDVATYEKYYKRAHPCPELLSSFVYGLPELNYAQIQSATRVAVPGCFATCIALGLIPLAKAGLLNAPVRTVAMTGSSGSGAYAKPGTHHPLRANNLRAYEILKHRHAPEIAQTVFDAGAGEGFRLDFVPMSAPLPRGIFATSVLDVPADVDAERVTKLLHDAYEGRRFVKIVTRRSPEVVSIVASNYAEVGFSLGEVHGERRSLVMLTTLDNLVKGGAGQAIQNMNIVLGLKEDAGMLGDMGTWP